MPSVAVYPKKQLYINSAASLCDPGLIPFTSATYEISDWPIKLNNEY